MKIGLTGGLASGKSTVARQLAASGFTVVDADGLVAELYRSGQPGAAAVAELFGPALLDDEGNVDHQALAQRVFADADDLQKLEERIHPLVRDVFARRAAAASGPVVLEATLLCEAGYAPDFDLVVTVEADRDVRLRRAMSRGLTEPEARARLEAQGEAELRTRAADVIIRNDGSLAELSRRVERLAADLRARAAALGLA